MFTPENIRWIAEKLGVPTLFSVVLCVAIYRTGTWTAEKVFEPLVNKHIEFLTTEQQVMKSIATDFGKQTVEMQLQTKLTREIRDDQRKFPAVAEQMR